MVMRNQLYRMFCKYYILFSLLTIILLVYSAYSNTFNSPPALDDFHTFIDEPLVKIDRWSMDSFLSIFETKFGWCRSIPMLTFAVDISIGNGEIFYLHTTNFIIHLANLFCVFFLVSRLAQCVNENKHTSEILPDHWDMALWVAGIWALQPIQASAVTYLVQRMTSIMTLFYLLSVSCYLTARSIHLRKKTLNFKIIIFYVICIIATVMAFLSKENSLMIPIMLFCTEVWFFQQDLPKHIFKYAIKHWIIFSIVISLLILFGLFSLNYILSGYSARNFTLNERLLTESRVVVWYISLLLWPNPNRFSIEHDIEISKSLIDPITTLFSLGVIVFIVIMSIYYRKNYKLITYGIIWFILNLIIESTFIPLELIFEHRLYIPSVGIIISIVGIIYYFFKHHLSCISISDFKIINLCIFMFLFSVLSLMTFNRNIFFENIVFLNEHNVETASNNPRSHANLAVALARIGMCQEAIEKARYSIAIGKENCNSYYVAANTILLAYEKLNKSCDGVREAEKLISEQPVNANLQGLVTLCSNLAVIYAKMEDYKNAFDSIQRMILYSQKLTVGELDVQDLRFSMIQFILHEVQRKNLKLDLDGDGICDPGNLPTKTWIARYFSSIGYPEKAKELLCRSKAEYSENITTLDLLENLEIDEDFNRIQSAKWSFREKYVQQPFSRFNACMAAAYLIRERKLPSPLFQLGENILNYAMKLQPDSPDVYLLKGWYNLEVDKSALAVESAREALKLDPKYAKAWLGLGFFLVKANQHQEAISSFQKCLELYPGYPEQIAIHGIIRELQIASADKIYF